MGSRCYETVIFRRYVGSQSYHCYQFLVEIERVLGVCSANALRFRTAVHGAFPVEPLVVIVANKAQSARQGMVFVEVVLKNQGGVCRTLNSIIAFYAIFRILTVETAVKHECHVGVMFVSYQIGILQMHLVAVGLGADEVR